MKKINKGFLIFIVLILISLLCYIGLMVFAYSYKFNILLSALFQILGVIITLPLFVGVHEFGHMVFGLISGYSLLTFRIGPFEWYRRDGRVAFKLNPLSNFVLGQCLMSPPKLKKKEKPKFFLYNAGGLIFSYLFLLIGIGLFFILYKSNVKFILIPFISLSLFLTLNNSIYIKGGFNDVCNHVLVKNNPKYINSVLYQLEMISNIISGKRYGTKTFYEPYFEEKLNHITIPVAQFKFLQAVDKSDFAEAKRIAGILKRNYNKIPMPIQRVTIIFPILFTDIVIDQNIKEFKRHFKWIHRQEKELCTKSDSDIKFNYLIYEKLSKDEFDIKDIIDSILNSDILASGERLSLAKMYQFLLDKITFYLENGKSFIKKESI